MKEINIANVLVNRRKEKGITQDELANYMGVSKASVSKWETGQSYPDITFLPQLAAYFNISIDDLMDYKPQMTKEDIRKLYIRLSADFASKPFDEVIHHCREVIKKYFACFPLLLQMGILVLNHSTISKNNDSQALIHEAMELFIRVKDESGDAALIRQALYMEALCRISIGEPNVALDLLEGTVTPALPPEVLLASAYQMSGKPEQAKSVLQVGIYQDILVMFNFFPSYLMLCTDTPDRYNEILRRALIVAEAFDLKRLHPGVFIGLFLSAAQGYMIQGNHDRALDMLQSYTDIVTSDIYPLSLHGDDFFNLLNEWLEQIDLGTALPRNEKTIRQSMSEGVINNPAFSALVNEHRFQRIVERLKNNY
jgi:transcriptional regulator with XRE-family HTH domain